MPSFDGEWRIDAERSKVWDYETGQYLVDEVGEEIIRIRTDGDIQDYEVLLGDRPTIRMGYTNRFDDKAWVDYTVREVIGVGEGQEESEIRAFIERTKSHVKDFSIGASYGLVRSVYVDERTHYRLSKSPKDGSAEYIMLRRLDENGEAYTATVMRTDGIVSRIRRFIRIK
ncbi:MAG: hypothetical protein JWO15_1400 [Sphingomonadales bacterium]|nr:hypothetical protein [Sphingomonadales bacterium]